MRENVLRVEQVTMQFGGVVAVNDLSLEVNRGEIVALIGPNGAGKTTAFNCITGVYEPTNGRVSFLGETMVENYPQGKMQKLYAGENQGLYTKKLSPTPDHITRLGIARTFQNIRLFGALSVFDNVLIAKHMRARQNFLSATFRLNAREERRMRQEAMALLEEQNLAHLKDEIAGSLPYGLQRRLEIARALATDPKLLLLDEPAAGMNPQETQELTDFIKQIPRGVRPDHLHDRAPHGSGHADLRAHLRPGLRQADRPGHPGGRPERSPGHRGLFGGGRRC